VPLKSLDDYMSAGGIVASLQLGCTLATDVYNPDKSKAAGPIHLTEGDEVCDECGELITAEDYPGANYGNVLARLKLKYDGTACSACLPQLKGRGEDEEPPGADGDEAAASAD
jgi:hypothetical protein